MNIQPHHKTIGVVSANNTQDRARVLSGRWIPTICPIGEITTTNADRLSATQKRVRMSASIEAAIAGSDMSCDSPCDS